MDFCLDESPAVKALGPLFKLTEVQLWDDGSSEGIVASYVQDPVKLLGSDKGCEKGDCERTNGFCSLAEEVDVELAKEMNDLGLPLSFRTNKQTRYGMPSGKKKGSRKINQETPIEIDDYMQDSSKGSEDQIKSPASVLNTSEMLDESDNLKSGTASEIGCSPNLPLGNGHEYNGEESNPECDACYGGISVLANDMPDEAKSLHQEVSFVTARSDDGQTNDINMEVIKDSEVAPHEQFCEQTDYKMISSSGEWIAYWDGFHMATFFYNVNTQESTWDPPPGMEHLVYSNVADESTNTASGLSELDNNQMDIRMSEEVQAFCDLELVRDLANKVTDDPCSLSPRLDGISGNSLPADNASITNTTNKKKKARKAKSKKKLSSSSEDLWGVPDELPSSISKYWLQRYLLFSRFDSGIKLDEEGWYSVTPEILAKHQAERCGHGVVVDLFTGAGGNAIQFARRSRHVIAIDIDPIKIEYASHNAAIYEVDDRIDFIKGDCFSLAPKLKADTVFMSPPWGGPDYSKQHKFDIDCMPKPRDGKSLFDVGREIAPKIVMFLPKNVDVNQLAELSLSAVPPWSLEVEKNYLNGQFKAVTAYFCHPSATS